MHSTMKAAILISLGVEFCEYNQSVGAFLLMRLVESSGCQGIEGSLIELLCSHVYGHGDAHTSHISPDLFLGRSECLPSFVYSLRYQI